MLLPSQKSAAQPPPEPRVAGSVPATSVAVIDRAPGRTVAVAGPVLVPGEGLEPSWHCCRRILSPLRLPVPPSRPRVPGASLGRRCPECASPPLSRNGPVQTTRARASRQMWANASAASTTEALATAIAPMPIRLLRVSSAIAPSAKPIWISLIACATGVVVHCRFARRLGVRRVGLEPLRLGHDRVPLPAVALRLLREFPLGVSGRERGAQFGEFLLAALRLVETPLARRFGLPDPRTRTISVVRLRDRVRSNARGRDVTTRPVCK